MHIKEECITEYEEIMAVTECVKESGLINRIFSNLQLHCQNKVNAKLCIMTF